MNNLVSGVTQRYTDALGSPTAAHLAALKELWNLTYREASTLAYADAFLAIMIAFLLATLLVPFLRNVVPSPAPVAAH